MVDNVILELLPSVKSLAQVESLLPSSTNEDSSLENIFVSTFESKPLSVGFGLEDEVVLGVACVV